MKGLREFALSCLLFGGAASVAATEIADNLLKLDPLVYFGAESFGLDEVKGLNRGRADVSLGFSSSIPTTVPSFVGEHAGQALPFGGRDSFTLPAGLLSDEKLEKGVVLSFFAASDSQAQAGEQCLFSLGDDIALTLEENTFKVYQRREGVRTVDWADMSGPSEDGSAIFLKFSGSEVEVYKNFDLVWTFEVGEEAQRLSEREIVLGDCDSGVKEALIEDGVDGFHGWLDELLVVENLPWEHFSPRKMAPEEWESEGGDDQTSDSIDFRALHSVVLMAQQGVYPMYAERTSSGSYKLGKVDVDQIFSFAGFVYPDELLERPVEWAADLFLEGQEDPETLYFSNGFGQVSILHQGEGFFWLNPIAGAERIEVNCSGDSTHCQELRAWFDQGIAFGAPVHLEPTVFGVELDGLPSAYDRALRNLNFTFSDALTAVDVLPQALPAEWVNLYVATDEAGEQWEKLPIERIEASGNNLELKFSPRLKNGRYRIEFDATLSSHAGVALGEMQRYEFTVASAELLVSSSTSIGLNDFQHDGKRLIVDGATLTLSGVHDYESVIVRNSGVITSPANQAVSISADEIEVDASSRIDVSSKGQLGTAAIGNNTGGSYGGSGGSHSGGVTNAPYGDFREPKDFGTGGRQGSGAYTRGGGAIELHVGVLKLDGLIQANGQFHTNSYGSGSGGSLLLRVDSLMLGAQARIEANGGGSSASYTYGGGGGGRVALYYGELTQGALPTQVLAKGGLSSHAQPGAAGSIYLKNITDEIEELVFNNTGVPASAPAALLDLSAGASYSGKVTVTDAVVQVKGDATFSEVGGSNGRLIGSYRNADNELIVDGYTFELDRSGTWSKVRVINGGVITTPYASGSFTQAVSITADEIEVDASSRIDVSSKGQLGTAAIGNNTGGSYGGSGGSHSGGVTNAPYGDFREPKDFGIGGRQGSGAYTRGGGAIELHVGVLKLDGLIQANGQFHTNSYGSGSGGSLLLRVDSLMLGAQARIEANGGGSSASYTYGGGGGGRVALYYGELTQGALPTQVLAKGGLSSHAQPGAAGSIYLKNITDEIEELVFNNTGVPASAPAALLDLSAGASYSGKVTVTDAVVQVKGDATFSEVGGSNGRLIGSYRNADNELIVDGYTFELDRSGTWSKVRVINGGVITTPYASGSFTQAVSITADEIEVDASSRIDVSSKGQLGTAAIGNNTGGSYGGSGGSHSGGVTNAPYGDFREPKDFGTGGRQGSGAYTRGGGAIELHVGVLKLDGLIQANGQFHTNSYGSGSGGSLLLRVDSLILGAQARIEANGGGSSANHTYGGGGGGRVALYYGELTQGALPTQVLAKGGLSNQSQPGAAGTVYLKNTTTEAEELVLNNTGVPSSAPAVLLDLRDEAAYNGKISLINVIATVQGDVANEQFQLTSSQLFRTHVSGGGELIVDGYTLTLNQSGTWSKVRVINGGVITTALASADATQGITITADEIEVDASSRIDVSNKGRRSTAAMPSNTGHSYGGRGGSSSYGVAPAPYGNYLEPRDFGVGGYASGNTRGGGAIELKTALMKLDGGLLANGQNVAHTSSGSFGSGSGGSILLSVDRLELGEKGRIEANGGGRQNAECCYASGGGGGRIAVNYKQLSYSGAQPAIRAKGGVTTFWSTGHEQHGAAGTVYLNDLTNARAELIIDNSGIDKARAARTELDLGEGGELTAKLTLINANVELTAAKLGEVVATNSYINQKSALTVSDLMSTDGVWDQAGHALLATQHRFTNTTFKLSGSFSSNASNELIVDGYVAELSKSEAWSKVRVINGGVITTALASADATQGITITADEIEVDASSRIDVSNKGRRSTAAMPSNTGHSYGGRGGSSSYGVAPAPYGNYLEPRDFGVGGYASGNTRGGGAIELKTALMKLDGGLLANGQNVAHTSSGSFGSGSGGSILLSVDRLELGEKGRIEANGGGRQNAECCYASGGGGGRIAVNYKQLSYSGAQPAIRAKGGVTTFWSTGHEQHGAAGTVYLNDLTNARAELIIDNSGIDKARAARTELDLGEGGELTAKLTLINANVELTAAKLGEVVATNSYINQKSALTVSDLMSTDGVWDQAGHALLATQHRFTNTTFKLSGSFSSNASNELIVDGYVAELSKSEAWSKVRVINGGVITTALASADATQGITITADEIEVDASSRIDVSNKGRRSTAAMPSNTGHSYGGRGGSSSYGVAPAPYGNYLEPRDFGVGGYASGNTRGGGAIELKTALMKLDGGLLANGQNVAHTSSGSFGSGSGGSILLSVDRLELGEKGRIEANGGGRQNAECCYASGGGGGRIAVNYKQLSYSGAQPAIRAKGGVTTFWSTGHEQHGAAGTVYLNDLTNARAELIIDNSGIDKARAARTELDLGEGGELTAKLTLINANVQLIGAKLSEVSLKDSVASVKIDEIAELQSSNSQLNQAADVQVGNLQLTGGSWNQAGFALNADSYKFTGSTLLLSGPFNQAANDLIVDGYTAELAQSLTWNSVRVINGGVITTPLSSDTFTQGITITADEIEVDATSRIDVSAKGLLPSVEVGNYCGGSHGGLGGSYGSCTTNAVYGDYLTPVAFGMGGRQTAATNQIRGGGALKLVTRSFKLDGQLLANGATSSVNTTVGGGAGGSLWVDTQVLLGSATTRIQAKGGNGLHSGGPGGGGRIAIYYAGLEGIDVLSQISVAAGAKTGSATAGQPGSLHLENRVVSTAVAGADVAGHINREVTSFTLDFINAVEPESVSAETVRLSGPNGPVAITAISAVNTVRYRFDLVGILADGAYELRAGPNIRSAQGRGMDQNNNGIEDEAEDVFVRTFVVDRLPPQAPVVTSPLVAPAINASNLRKVTVSGERENQAAILINGVQQIALGDGPWTISNYALAEGQSELQVQTRDAAGNTSPATLLNFNVDSLVPSIQQYSHNGSTKTVPSSVWVRFNEAGSGLDFAGSSLTLKRSGNLISGQLSLEGDVLRLTPNSTLLEGVYSVAMSLRDKAGNQSNGAFNFTLDYTAPQAPVVNTYPALTTNKQLLISGTKESGSTLRVFNAANTQLTSICCSATTWQYNLTLEPGDNSFSVEQTDSAGNVSPRTTLQIRFDDQAPGPVVFTLDPKGSGTEVKLAWPSYSEAANGNDIQQYRVYSALQAFSQIDQAQLLLTVPSGTKQAVVKNLNRGEERYFAVVAVDQQGLLLSDVTALAATPEDVQAPSEASALLVKSAAEQLELSWQASANAAGDLAGYALYIGAGNAQRIELPLAALSDGLRYTLSDLAPASATPLRLVAVDNDGNESAGLHNLGITWLNNPQNLQLEPLSNRFDASWEAVSPTAWVSGYRLYVADEPFTSVQGKTPKATTNGQLSAAVSGLLNNKTYHAAVTVVNASGGENPQVQSFSITPAADSVGPELTQLSWHSGQGAQDLRGGGELSQLGEWRIQATDESGIGRIDLSLNGQPLGQAIQAGGYYRYAWDLSQVADGDYELAINLQDTLENASQHTVALEVALAAPAQPSLSLQSKASKTNQPQQVLIVQGQANSLAQISHNGSEQGELLTLNGSGQAQLPLTLEEGDNQLTARLRYSSRDQFGADSAPLTVNLDSTLPNAPGNLQATAKAQGVVQLSWAAVNGVAGYNLYVANQPFAAIGDAGVSKLNSKALTTLSYAHQTSSDDSYYYRVSSVNALSSESALSAQRSAKADRTAPRVEEALYSSQGQISADGRFAPGRVEVRLRLSEPLRNAPFFSLDVPQGVSIPVHMSQAANDPLVYQGSFDLSNAVPSGLLYARVSAYDPVGNEGSEVLEGKTLRIDTQGPELQQLSLLPESPVENLVVDNQGREVQVVLRLSEDPVALPQLTPLLDGQALAGQNGPLQLTQDAQSQAGAPVYIGQFRLPASAGQTAVQLLGFDYQASDDLGNSSQRILGRREFQVYQGDLPPLDIPQGLSGKALAGGRVALTWSTVKEAGAYQLYRRAEADSDFTAVGRVRELAFEDNLPAAGQADGVYFYQVASIREHDGKEALSLPSEPVKVQVLSQAPGAPRDLSVELNGAGIVLRWLAPAEGQATSYNLYRANVGQGQSIDIAGLSPLQSKIPERIALDSRPSDSEHAYTVTAVDAAGNESAPADSVYLNAGLLPVRDLSIRLAEGQAPSLQWDHSGKDVVGYNLYVGAGESAQKLNGELLTSKSYSDQSVSLPLTGERLYSVTAVDAQSVESLPHALLLPAVKAELRTEQRFERGVFNQLYYRVTNSGTQELKRLRLRVDVSSGGQIKQHLSDYFNVAAGAVAEVPVVIAGYQDLPGVVPLSVEILYAPQVGEAVSIQRSESITAGENTLLVQVLADEFTRGGSGSVRLRLENPSAVATELVTAHSNGNQASSEMRLILEDLQGNVLATQAVKAAVGNGLITVRDGRTVARVGAYDVLETGPFSIQVPQAAPDRVRLRLEADFLHYQTALPGELKIGGLRSSRELTLVEAPYYGEISEVSPAQVQAGDSVTIRGRALSRDTDQPLAGVELKLILNVRGFERVVTLTTDAQGGFVHQHKTASGDSGEHQLSLIHPSIQLRPQHGHFLVQGAAFSPASVNTSFPRNYEQTVTIVVEAGHDTPLQNLRLEAVGDNLPAGLKVQHSSPLNLAAKQRGNLILRISGDNSAAASGLLDYRIVADGLARPIGQTRIQYKLVAAQPMASVSPIQVTTGLARDSEQVEQVTLSNSGLDVLRNVRVSLLDEQGGNAPSWVSLRTVAHLGDLPSGASNLIGVAFQPTVAVPEGDHYFTLRIQSDNSATVDVPMSVAVTQSGKGGVIFLVEDIYTGTLDTGDQLILGLKGAKIKLQNRNVLSTEFTGTTDAKGQVLLEDIPAGEYSYRISAWDHDDLSGQLWIKPGVTESERVFLMSKLVTVEWSVKEIALQDRYEIILNATFKTKVPTALVMIEPLSINLPPMRKGDVFQGELTLTNYGLIRADEVRASLPVGDARARIEYLRTVPDTLEAGDVVVIPYRIVALQSFDPDDVLNGAAGCWSFNYQGSVNYKSQCANGQVIPGRSNVAWSANGNAGSCGGGGGIGGGGAGGWGGWGSGGGGGFIPRPTPLGSDKQCPPPPDCENGNCGGNGGTN